ncbi:MAG TPA: C2H2-type zinc finger protein [Thermoplasmata archaeon]|nr:C2H2-type zinc finger protein [Thermoplasmata archaeon]
MALFKKKYTCSTCGMNFGSEADLVNHSKAHMSTAQPSNTFTCAACGATFRAADELRAHNRSAHKM